MRYRADLLTVLAAVAITAALPGSAQSGVAIYLKNGVTMTADQCDDTGEMLTCYKMGGSFLLNRSDVERIKEAKTAEEDQPAAAETATPVREGAGDSQDKKKEASPEERFGQIQQRKMQMQDERQKLEADRVKLQGDVKQAPDWMQTEQFDALSKRNKEMDERVKKFNEEVKRLNEEEKKILGTQPQPKGE